MVQAWKTVRIFISSTFCDMHAERDHLVKVVFPELRERMAQRHLHLVDIDLRWGVTEAEAEQGKLLEIILDEIERSRPFFIAILGERYGFIPDKVPEDVEFMHPWLRNHKGHSLTALEIVHGVLKNPDLSKRSFFYFRDPEFISQILESRRADFAAESPEAARKLAALKNKIRASDRPLMENYPCRWDNAEGRVVDLDAFGQRVLEDLWTAICEEYPEEAPEPDPLTIERQMHEAFVEERSRLHIGREEQAARLTEYVQGKDRRPVVITGESGCGKSAFLASWYRKYTSENPDDFVLAYFIGASPDSANHHRLLRNICEELKHKFALKEEIPQEDKKLSEALALLLFAASRDKSRIVLVLDALDQLSPLEVAHGLGWLLDYMPEKARLVVSSLEGDCLEVLRSREAEEISLPPLTENEQRQIVETVLSEWRRRLDDKQMKALLAHPGVKNPLYLRIALEELRLFGIFEQLTKRIETLAHDIPGLFDQVLARLEKDHGRELVAETFALLGCSRYGLSEKEMLELLRREGEEQLPRAVWVRLARSAKAYLVQRGEFIGFFHRQLADAVAARYLSRDKRHVKLNAHLRLADYFGSIELCSRKVDELPWQLSKAQKRDRLKECITDLDMFIELRNTGKLYELRSYWSELSEVYDVVDEYTKAIKDVEAREGIGRVLSSRLGEVAGFLWTCAEHAGTETFLRRAVEIDRRCADVPQLDVATHLLDLARVLKTTKRPSEAEALIRQALNIVASALGSSHPKVTAGVNLLANTLLALGRRQEVEAMLRRALEIDEKSQGRMHPDVARDLVNLANALPKVFGILEAEDMLRRALTIYERYYIPKYPEIAVTLNNLADVLMQLGRFRDAEPMLRRALDIDEKCFGPNHPDTARDLHNLAYLLRRTNRLEDAEPMMHRVLKIDEAIYGPDHPEVAVDLHNLAGLYRASGRRELALSIYRRALNIMSASQGLDHPSTQTVRSSLLSLEREME